MDCVRKEFFGPGLSEPPSREGGWAWEAFAGVGAGRQVGRRQRRARNAGTRGKERPGRGESPNFREGVSPRPWADSAQSPSPPLPAPTHMPGSPGQVPAEDHMGDGSLLLVLPGENGLHVSPKVCVWAQEGIKEQGHRALAPAFEAFRQVIQVLEGVHRSERHWRKAA